MLTLLTRNYEFDLSDENYTIAKRPITLSYNREEPLSYVYGDASVYNLNPYDYVDFGDMGIAASDLQILAQNPNYIVMLFPMGISPRDKVHPIALQNLGPDNYGYSATYYLYVYGVNCSANYDVTIDLDDNAKVHKEWFGHTVINSDRRFNYDEVQEIIEQKQGELSEVILQLHQLAQILRKKRFDNNAINFETEEVKFKLDENSKPIGVYLKVQKEANFLIEEMMLLANRRVAEKPANVPHDSCPEPLSSVCTMSPSATNWRPSRLLSRNSATS